MEPKKYTVSSIDVEEFKKAQSEYETAYKSAVSAFERWQDNELSADRLVDYISNAEGLRRKMYEEAHSLAIACLRESGEREYQIGYIEP